MLINRALLVWIIGMVIYSAFFTAYKFDAVKSVITAQSETIALMVEVLDKSHNKP